MASVERATSDLLIGPDWAMNLEICDILNHEPGQAKDIIKGLKRRIGHRNPKVQLLALTLLETIIKNCSDIVHMHVADRDIPHEMAKIVRKKPDFHVKEKILVLIDTWQEAFGGTRARYPQYYCAYEELLRHGVVFPKRPDRSVPLFTPARTMSNYGPSSRSPSYRQKGKDHTDDLELPTMSFTDMEDARGIMGVLSEMLDALDPDNKEGIKQEVIIDLVHQCRAYREILVHLVNATSDEDLLREGLALNDDLQVVVAKYDAMAAGIAIRAEKPKTLQALVDFDDPSNTNQDESHTNTNNQHPLQHLLLPAPPTPNGGNPHIDLLSGDFDTPAPENPLALVTISGQMGNSTNEQNMLSLSDMFSQSNDIGSNSSPPTPFDIFSPNSALQAYPSTPRASLYSNGCVPNIGIPQYEQAAYNQGGQLNHASHNTQSALALTLQEQPFDGSDDESLPPPPWEAQPTQGGLPEGDTYSQMLQNSQLGGMYSLGFQSNQHLGMYPYPMQSSQLAGVYSEQMQDGHLASYAAYGQQQQQGAHFYDQQPSYPSYAAANDISQGMYGLSMQNSSSSYTNASSYLQQQNKPLKPEDKLFGDLVSMAKSKQSKPRSS